MEKIKTQKISIALDLKKNRIRIHQKTLKKLGNPDHLNFMINPAKLLLALSPCPDYSDGAVLIKYADENECELYSKPLLTLLSGIYSDILPGGTYRINGEADDKGILAVFSLKDIEPIKEETAKKGGGKRHHEPLS